MNTGFLGPAVATVLTVYGIETVRRSARGVRSIGGKLQQYLPFTVLKHPYTKQPKNVITGWCCNSTYRLRY